MKKAYMLLLVMLSSVVLVACGSSTSTPGKPFATEDRSSDRVLYTVGIDTTVSAETALGESIDYLLEVGSIVSIIERSNDNQYVRLGVDNDQTQESIDFWTKIENLDPMNLQKIDDQDPYDSEGFERLPEDGDVEAFLRKMTYCYRYVKKYLLKVGLVKEYLPGASAYMAANILPKYGFKKVSRSPSQAIVHDVCVYKGGPSGHGHTEIKTSKGWYYGYGYKATPIKNRILIACYHK